MKKLEDLAKELEKEIKKENKKIIYAAIRSLNETAFLARKNLMTEYHKAFNVRNKSLPKKVSVKKATKKEMIAEVGFPFDWMYINTKGGTKRPEAKKNLSIPIEYGVAGSRLASGKIKTAFKPVNLLKYADTHKKKRKGKVATPHAVKIKTQKGKELIARRRKENRKEMEWLYVQTPTAEVKKKWDFEGIVRQTVEKNLVREFEKAVKWIADHPKK